MSDDGGRFVPKSFIEAAAAFYVRPMPWPRTTFPPLTRWQRVRATYYGWRWRVEAAWGHLRGRGCSDD